MTTYSDMPRAARSTRFAELAQRIFFAVPVIGWIARDVAYGDESNVYFALIAFVSLWAISAMTFGLPGLYLPALALVPVMFAMLIWISMGRIDTEDTQKTRGH